MGILLMLVGLVALVSGATKLRGRARASIGFSRLGAAEVLFGALALGASAVGLSRIRSLAWTVVVAAMGLTLVSTWVHTRRIAGYLKRREQGEALRLKTYLHTRRGDSARGRG